MLLSLGHDRLGRVLSTQHISSVDWMKIETWKLVRTSSSFLFVVYAMQSIVTKPKPYPSGVRSRATTFGFCSFSVFTHTPPMCHYSQKPHRFRIKFRELPLLFSALVSSFVFLLVKKKITATCSKSSLCLVFWCAKVATNKTPHTDGGDLVFPMALTPPPPTTHTHTLFYILCFL